LGKWVYGNQQQNDNALTARIIAQIGDQITQALLTKAAMKQKEGSYKQAASDNLTKFVGMTADERQQFLNSPGGIQQVTEMVDPHLYSKHDTGKEGFAKPSYEGILGMGAETEPERAIRGGKEAQAAKFGFEANKAALELNEKMDQMKFQSEFFDMGKKFEAGGEDAPTPKEYMGAALRAGYKEALSNPMSLLDPGSLVKQEEQKVVGSDAWKKLKGAEMLTELQKQRPVHNQEQADQMVNLGKYLGGDTSAVVDWTKINPDWRDAENDLKKQQLDVQKQELWRNTLKDTSDLYTTIVTNGVPAKDAERFLDEFQKTGRPPKDIPWPQDKIKVLQAQVEQANLNKMTIEAKHAEQELPEFKQALDLWRATASDDVKGQARAAKQAWDLFYKMHPEYKGMPQPGFWDKMLGFMKGTGNYAQGAAGVAGATASDAAAGIAGQRTPDSVWPMGQDIMNVSRAVGGGLTAAGNYVDSAVK
jgi:hypothetical protein